MQIIRIFRWEKKRCIQKGLFFIHFRRSYPQYQRYPWERITRLLTMLQVFWSFIVFSFYYLSSILFCFFTGMFVTFSLERTARIENSIRYSLWSNLLLVCKQIAEKPVYNIRRLHVSSGLKNLRSPREDILSLIALIPFDRFWMFHL